MLVSDESISDGGAEDRLGTIRRATGLDLKTSLVLVPPDPTSQELRAVVDSVLQSLQPLCIEYYRELSKHARRKRNRSTIPPPTAPPTSGTSQTLSYQGWNVRYEFKLGVFAEFRQEMDAACQNYEGAYEGLMGQDIFGSIAGWDPKFNDARMLADIIATRIIRCLLWNGQTTSAAKTWDAHRTRMQELIDTRGKGTNNYGWEAWEAGWSAIMAELVSRAVLPCFKVEDAEDESVNIKTLFAPPEKAVPTGERLAPWELLHHQGYWFNRSSRYAELRRQKAEDMPEEDRAPPGESPASTVANKSYLYDTYLCPEPHIENPLPGRTGGFDHSQQSLKALHSACVHFSLRTQNRFVERLRLQKAKQLMRVAAWQDALNILGALWADLTWRQAGWWSLVEEVGWALRECAVILMKGEVIITVDWELMHNSMFCR